MRRVLLPASALAWCARSFAASRTLGLQAEQNFAKPMAPGPKQVDVLCDVFVVSHVVGMVRVAEMAMWLRKVLVAHPFGSGLIGVHHNCTVVKNSEHRTHDQSSSEACGGQHFPG